MGIELSPVKTQGFELDWLEPERYVRATAYSLSQVKVVLKGACQFGSHAATTTIGGSYAALIPGRQGFDLQAEGDGALVATINLSECIEAQCSARFGAYDMPPGRIGRIEDSHSYFLISRLLSIGLATAACRQSDTLVAELSRHLATGAWQSPGGNPDGLSRVADVIHNRAINPPAMEELADMANLHPMSLARKFRAIRGCSIGEFRLRMRAERAFYLMIKSALSLSQVSLVSGFSDQSHMTRHFRRYLGTPPSSLRRVVESRVGELEHIARV